MKKTLFLLLCAMACFSVLNAADDALSESQDTPAVEQATRKLFMPVKPVPAPKIPTITAGWLDITDKIEKFEEILMPLTQLVENPDIDIIVIRINSTGGSPGDSEIIANYIHAAKQHKPIIAFISRVGTSAAYWIASACTYIICPASAEVGNIGAGYYNIFEKDKQYYYITSGKLKAPRINQHHEVDPLYTEHLEKILKESALIFANSVSKYRTIPVDTILSWEAAEVTGAMALKLGLVDQNGTMQELLEKIVELVSKKNNTEYQQLALISTENKVIKTYQL